MRAAGAAGLVADCRPVYGDAFNLRVLELTGRVLDSQNGPTMNAAEVRAGECVAAHGVLAVCCRSQGARVRIDRIDTPE